MKVPEGESYLPKKAVLVPDKITLNNSIPNCPSQINRNIILHKSYLFNTPNPSDVTKMYLIKGDKVKFLQYKNDYFYIEYITVEYGVTSCLQKGHFLSQVLCESDFFRTAEEYKNRNGSIPSQWSNYSGGSDYHGRGIIQITHDYNYKAYGIYVNNQAIKDTPDIVSNSLDDTIRSGFWYWMQGSA